MVYSQKMYRYSLKYKVYSLWYIICKDPPSYGFWNPPCLGLRTSMWNPDVYVVFWAPVFLSALWSLATRMELRQRNLHRDPNKGDEKPRRRLWQSHGES